MAAPFFFVSDIAEAEQARAALFIKDAKIGCFAKIKKLRPDENWLKKHILSRKIGLFSEKNLQFVQNMIYLYHNKKSWGSSSVG